MSPALTDKVVQNEANPLLLVHLRLCPTKGESKAHLSSGRAPRNVRCQTLVPPLLLQKFETMCCFFVTVVRQRLPRMNTLANTKHKISSSSPQPASEDVSTSIPPGCQRNKLSARGIPIKYLPTRLARPMSFVDGLTIAQHTCISAS